MESQACIYDNAKFYHKLKDAACQWIELEQYTPWWNAVERKIKELKKGLTLSCWDPENKSAYGAMA